MGLATCVTGCGGSTGPRARVSREGKRISKASKENQSAGTAAVGLLCLSKRGVLVMLFYFYDCSIPLPPPLSDKDRQLVDVYARARLRLRE